MSDKIFEIGFSICAVIYIFNLVLERILITIVNYQDRKDKKDE